MMKSFREVSDYKLAIFSDLAALNIIVHSWTDDIKVNYRDINLVQDQIIHLAQIAFTYAALVLV